MTLSRRHFLQASAGTAALGALGLPAFAQSGTFVANMYGGRWENDWRQTIMPQFSELTGVPFELDIGLGMAWASNFRAAGPENPPFPVVMFNERFTAMLSGEGYFDPLTPELVPNMADLIAPAVVQDGLGVTAMLSPIVIAYRTDLVDTPPTGWADLWHERFRGQIGLYAITNSAAAMLAHWAGEHFGSGRDDIETAVAKFKELAPFPQIAFSSQLTPLLIQGQVAVAPIDIVEVKALQDQGIPVDFVVPEEGMMVYDQTFSLFSNAPDKDLGAQYINFVLSPEIQLWMAENWLIAPTNRTVEMPPELEKWPLAPAQLEQAIRFDWSEVNAQSSALSDLWTRTI